jgi:hypothetical protein
LSTTLSAIDPRGMKDAVAVMLTSRPAPPAVALAGPRRLSVVHPGNIDRVFEDAAPAAEGASCPS